ncbi:MAG: DUF779 domain-containing protein [Egibacteraceae bacterium]
MAHISIDRSAAEKLRALRGQHENLGFKIDNGCCGGTTLLLIEGKYFGSGDIQIGEVEGVPVYGERSLLPTMRDDYFHIYAREGARDSGFSVEKSYGFKFLMRRSVFGTANAEE